LLKRLALVAAALGASATLLLAMAGQAFGAEIVSCNSGASTIICLMDDGTHIACTIDGCGPA
jgi:hypothetical protein